jgi:uncharacterized protein (TIGR02611 family)
VGETFDRRNVYRKVVTLPNLHSPQQWLRVIATSAKRLAVLVVGAAVLGAGIAMLVLPGPGILVIVLGLAILASEFAWAERALDKAKHNAAAVTGKISSGRSGRLIMITTGVAMLTGGALALALLEKHRALGVSALIVGVSALAVVVPNVQRRIADMSSKGPAL